MRREPLPPKNQPDGAEASETIARLMQCTVPVPSPRAFATLSMPAPLANWRCACRSTVLGTLGRPSRFPCALARVRPALIRYRIM